MKKIILGVIFSVNLAIMAYSQTKIQGTVKDFDTQEPVIGVHVFIPELQKGTTTDLDGTFKMKNIPTSKLQIEFSHVSYKTITQTIHPDEDTSEHYDIFLEPTVIHSDAVVVSAGTYTTQHENAIKIETLKGEGFKVSPAPSVPGKLEEIPGVDMIGKGNGVVKPVIRGLSNSNILVLNNGVKLENFQFSENHPFLIDEFGAERIEVIKGPASLLYGSDAVGGIINVIGEKPASTGSLEAELLQQFQTNGAGVNSHISFKRTYDDFFWGLNAGVKSHSDYKSGKEQFIPNSRFNNQGLHAFAGINKSFGSFKLYYDYTQMQLGMTLPGVDTLVDNGERKNNMWYQDLNNHLLISKNTFFFDQLKVEADFSYQENNRGLVAVNQQPVDMNLTSYSADLKGNYPITPVTDLTLGMQGNFKENQNRDAPNHVLPDHEVYDLAFNALLQHAFGDQLKMQAGLRYDYRDVFIPEQPKSGHSHEENPTGEEEWLAKLSRNYDNFSFSVGGTYHLSRDILIRSNVASAYRTPNIAELTQEGVHGSRYEKGNRDLQSQKNYEADLSLHYHCCHAMVDLSGFYNRVQNYIYLAPTGDLTAENLPVYEYGQTDARLYGGELNFEIKPTEKWHASLSFSKTIGKRNDGSHLPFIPQDKAKGGIRYQFGSEFKPYVALKSVYAFQQNNPSLFETPTEDYMLIHASLGGEMDLLNQTIEMSLSVHNIFNVTYTDHLSTLKPLGYFNMGRNITFTLKVPFQSKL
mgnify:CR=1 FL=1